MSKTNKVKRLSVPEAVNLVNYLVANKESLEPVEAKTLAEKVKEAVGIDVSPATLLIYRKHAGYKPCRKARAERRTETLGVRIDRLEDDVSVLNRRVGAVLAALGMDAENVDKEASDE